MTNLKNVREFRFGYIFHYQQMLDELINEKLERWEAENDDVINARYSSNGSMTTASHYWSIESDEMEEFTLRFSDHEPARHVNHNVDISSFITVVEDPDGWGEDDEWFVDTNAAEAAVTGAANAILSKIAPSYLQTREEPIPDGLRAKIMQIFSGN